MSQVDWDQFKELVRSRTDLVALFSESRQVTPRRGGREYVCLCPFHDDHSPSCTINPERQTYKCWACGEGGDCFSYMMKLDNLPFKEALEVLSRKAGLEMPKFSFAGEKSGSSRNKVLDCLEWATNQFHKFLLTAADAHVARDYLLSRGYNKQVWQQFQLGYHPQQWEWLLHEARNIYEPEILLEARLIAKKEKSNGYYDYFVDRVLFPIRNIQGGTVAFGGRVIPGREPPNSGKYFNSPESPLFSKSRILYGLSEAKEQIKQKNSAIVCEGYTDCISLHLAGVTNAVGTLGTALTEHHVGLLKRFTPLVYIVFDGDTAGQTAADRSLPRFIAQDLDLRIVVLPEKLDPAEYIQKYGKEKFVELQQHAQDAWSFKLGTLLKKYGMETDYSRQQILKEMLELLTQVPDISASAREDLLLSKLSQRLAFQEINIRKQLAELRQQNNRQTPSSNFVERKQESSHAVQTRVHNSLSSNTRLSREVRLAYDALEILLTEPGYASSLAPLLTGIIFPDPSLQMLWEILAQKWQDEGELPQFDQLLNELEDPSIKAPLVHLKEIASSKNINTLILKNSDRVNSPEDLPAYVRTVYDGLHFCSLEREHLHKKMQLANTDSPSNQADDQMIELLRQATLVHQKRTIKQTSATTEKLT